MTPSRNPLVAGLALGALVLTLIGAPWLVPVNSRAQEYACSDYLYREDAQNGFQDYEACPELPSRDTAPTCGDFGSQAEAQALYNQDPYRYSTLTDYGRGIGTDMTTACPELAAAPAVIEQPVPEAPVAVPDSGANPGGGAGVPAAATRGSTGGSAPVDEVAAPAEAVTADEPEGSDAIIAAGTCDTDEFGDPVAALTDVVSPVGPATGAGAFSTVATSYSLVDLTMDQLLAAEHVVVVFDEIQTERALACGPIGGVMAEDGSLSIGLRETPGAGWSGVAYLAPDTGGASITIFLADGLAPAGETPREA